MNFLRFLLLLLLIFIIVYLLFFDDIDNFFPTTRNMSYDIRGDPYIPKRYIGPWNMSSIYPIRNRQLII